jgi:uncharacterized membrane protein YciS (DUF1049 family)
MKKSLFGPIVGVIIGLLVIAMFVYVHISLNRMDKKIIEVQQTVVEDSAKISAVVNFFNSSQNE